MAQARSFNNAVAAMIALAGAVFALAGADAQAQRRPNGWQLCNETSYVLETSTARPDGRAILVQGWMRLRPGECRTAISAPLARGTHYLYARTSAAHRGGRRQWGGDARLCIDPGGSFTFQNPPQCSSQSLEERRFRRVQINKRDSWRTTLSEAQPYSLSRARQAGVQRLLNDAGYDIGEGRRSADPRRVAQAIAQFRTSARLAPGASEDQLLDALELAARRRAGQVGLTLCNRTRGRVWTAIARRRGEGWESRGWWALNAGGCVRTIDEELLQEVYYVYAGLETDRGLRRLAAGLPFCTSPSRFAIIGRADCTQRLYNTDLFAPIPRRDRTGLVLEFEDRDFLEPDAQPRVLQLTQEEAGPAAREPARRGLDPATAPTQPSQTQDRPQRQ